MLEEKILIFIEWLLIMLTCEISVINCVVDDENLENF